jgi:DNA-binding IclR family transcriptional regulator
MSVRDVKGEVLGLLKKVYPDSLTIKEIAQMLGVSRTTTSKYVAVLEGEGKVICRRVSRAKLCRARV